MCTRFILDNKLFYWIKQNNQQSLNNTNYSLSFPYYEMKCIIINIECMNPVTEASKMQNSTKFILTLSYQVPTITLEVSFSSAPQYWHWSTQLILTRSLTILLFVKSISAPKPPRPESSSTIWVREMKILILKNLKMEISIFVLPYYSKLSFLEYSL